MSLLGLCSFVWRHPLNASGRFAAIGRVLRWQVALPFVEDTRLLTTRGMHGATGNWHCGLLEERDMAFVLHARRPDDRSLDVDANVGSYALLAAGAVGAGVTAIEPIPSTFDAVERKIAFNGVTGRVRAVRCGLSDAPGTLRFTVNLDAMNRVLAAIIEVGRRAAGDVAGVMTASGFEAVGYDPVARRLTRASRHEATRSSCAIVRRSSGAWWNRGGID